MSTRDNEGEPGSCAISGTESQRTRWFCEAPDETETHMLDESARELAERGVEELELDTEAFGSCANCAFPEYRACGKMAKPGSRATLKGEEIEETLKPGDDNTEVDGEVRSW